MKKDNISCISFKPIIDDDSTILVLGTFPSIKSFENCFYYAHPKNQFWKILADIFNENAVSEKERRELLKKYRIALWDTCGSCVRKDGNSSDANLSRIEPNDIPGLLKKHPRIKMVCFTGKKSQQIFKKYFSDIEIETFLLPSPSPAYQAMKYEEKKEIYKKVLLG